MIIPVPGYISRSVAGSYDNEGIAIFALQFTYFLWVGVDLNDLLQLIKGLEQRIRFGVSEKL